MVCELTGHDVYVAVLVFVVGVVGVVRGQLHIRRAPLDHLGGQGHREVRVRSQRRSQ